MGHLEHHAVVRRFRRWEGYAEAGFTADFLGNMTRQSFFTPMGYSPERRFVRTTYPAFNDEYFEWIDLLEAVTEATGEFTLIELGAGWGRWMARAVAALQQCGGPPYRLIGVEPEPQHFAWMVEHLRENGVDLDRCQLIRAAVADVDGEVWFRVGKPDECYGQAIASGPLEEPATNSGKGGSKDGRISVEKVQAVSLNSLLRPLERVDLIDLDIQRAESMVLRAAADQLDQKVRRVHIGTHGPKYEASLRELFRDLGWQNLHDYSHRSTRQTPWGRIDFRDGVQTWVNPALAPASTRDRGPAGATGSLRLDALATPEGARRDWEQLRGEAEQLRAALDASEAGRRTIKKQLRAVRSELERTRLEVLTLQGRLRAAGKDPLVIRERLEDAQAKLKRARRQIEQMRSTRVWRLATLYWRASDRVRRLVRL